MKELAQVVAFLAGLYAVASCVPGCGGEVLHPGCYEAAKQDDGPTTRACDPAVSDTAGEFQ